MYRRKLLLLLCCVEFIEVEFEFESHHPVFVPLIQKKLRTVKVKHQQPKTTYLVHTTSTNER